MLVPEELTDQETQMEMVGYTEKARRINNSKEVFYFVGFGSLLLSNKEEVSLQNGLESWEGRMR